MKAALKQQQQQQQQQLSLEGGVLPMRADC
jgi:hypothetical protein